MTNPSSKWTDEERRDVMIAILDAELPEGKRLSELTPHKINDIGERIRFLASASSKFLEANREGILNGQ